MIKYSPRDLPGWYSIDQVLETAWVESTTFTTIGWDAAGLTKKMVYKKIGNVVLLYFDIDGVSDSGAGHFVLPYVGVTTVNAVDQIFPIMGSDAGSWLTTPARGVISSGSSQLISVKDYGYASWTDSGAKRIQGSIVYASA